MSQLLRICLCNGVPNSLT